MMKLDDISFITLSIGSLRWYRTLLTRFLLSERGVEREHWIFGSAGDF